MRNREHVLIAFAVGYVLYQFLNIGGSAFFPLVIGSVLPDVLEPAADYKHRGFFHSKRVLKKMPVSVLIGFIIGWSTGYYHLFFGLLGYSTHLLCDATTPMGLPR